MRKKRKITKNIETDPLYNNLVIAKFINLLMQSGKKTTAQTIVYDALEMIKEKNRQENPLLIFQKAIQNTTPRVEVITRRIGGAHYQVPREVGGDRKNTLAMRWTIQAARQAKGKKMSEKLANELMAAAKNEGEAIRKKREIEKVAEANRAFAHFAW